jgi:hypothetical protein
MSAIKNGYKPIRYVIRVKYHLDLLWEQWFEGMTIEHTEDGQTILSGAVVDQSALHGLLEKVRDLNLTLISVQNIDTDEKSDQVSQT